MNLRKLLMGNAVRDVDIQNIISVRNAFEIEKAGVIENNDLLKTTLRNSCVLRFANSSRAALLNIDRALYTEKALQEIYQRTLVQFGSSFPLGKGWVEINEEERQDYTSLTNAIDAIQETEVVTGNLEAGLQVGLSFAKFTGKTIPVYFFSGGETLVYGNKTHLIAIANRAYKKGLNFPEPDYVFNSHNA